MRLLAARPRTEAEIAARLARDGLGEEAAGVVLWLKGLGYLDDEAFARGRAAALLRDGRTGPGLAERRLVAAGVSPVLARRAVDEAMAAADGAGGEDGAAAGRAPGGRAAREAERCRALAERRARRPLAGLDPRARGRLARFLLSRGYSGAAVSNALGVYVDGGPDG